ncbi:MAG TPA: hypothetical protein VG146_12010 [Verrucomicrobiae bacterium]|nr:hypothetical protein [Verrucomicrobiae bacterium]
MTANVPEIMQTRLPTTLLAQGGKFGKYTYPSICPARAFHTSWECVYRSVEWFVQ